MGFIELIKEWGGVITIIAGSIWAVAEIYFKWRNKNEGTKQDIEQTAQAHEATRQEQVETDIKQFEYLAKRVEFAEQHIVTLHKKMTGMQNILNEYVARTIFAETHICLEEACKKRKPALGTFKPKCKRSKDIDNGEHGTEVQA